MTHQLSLTVLADTTILTDRYFFRWARPLISSWDERKEDPVRYRVLWCLPHQCREDGDQPAGSSPQSPARLPLHLAYAKIYSCELLSCAGNGHWDAPRMIGFSISVTLLLPMPVQGRITGSADAGTLHIPCSRVQDTGRSSSLWWDGLWASRTSRITRTMLPWEYCLKQFRKDCCNHPCRAQKSPVCRRLRPTDGQESTCGIRASHRWFCCHDQANQWREHSPTMPMLNGLQLLPNLSIEWTTKTGIPGNKWLLVNNTYLHDLLISISGKP